MRASAWIDPEMVDEFEKIESKVLHDNGTITVWHGDQKGLYIEGPYLDNTGPSYGEIAIAAVRLLVQADRRIDLGHFFSIKVIA